MQSTAELYDNLIEKIVNYFKMLQAVWDDYSVDQEGLVSLCEEDSVTVQKLEEMLTDAQKLNCKSN